jgi:hypothetical protein
MTEKPTGRRFIFQDRTLTPEEHHALWMQRVREAKAELEEAILIPPPKTVTDQVEVKPDDPRYADAPIGEVWVTMEGPTICVPKP